MPCITEQNNLGDLLKYEASNLYSRDQITVAKGQNLSLGAVVSRKTDDDLIRALIQLQQMVHKLPLVLLQAM